MVLTSRKAGPKGQAFEVSHEEAQVSSGTQKGGWIRDLLSIVHFAGVCWFLGCVLFCEKRLKWVRVNRSECPSQSYTSFCYEGWVSKVNVHHFLSPCPLRRLIVTVNWFFKFFWYEGTSTVYINQFFCGMNPHWRSTLTNFMLESTVDAISTVFSNRWICIDCWYQPYSQVSESLSTVDIDRIFQWVSPYQTLISTVTGWLKSNQPINDTCGKLVTLEGWVILKVK